MDQLVVNWVLGGIIAVVVTLVGAIKVLWSKIADQALEMKECQKGHADCRAELAGLKAMDAMQQRQIEEAKGEAQTAKQEAAILKSRVDNLSAGGQRRASDEWQGG